jgi:hypothetical protein
MFSPGQQIHCRSAKLERANRFTQINHDSR